MTKELSLDGLVGPTHTFSGLSQDNMASQKYQKKPSNPKKAALQGLDKMYLLHKLGVPQAVLPPHERPHLPTLRALGFSGSDALTLKSAAEQMPKILAAVGSASSMWAANCGTLSPSCDALDGKVQITPANLATTFHRSIEPPVTARILKAIFTNKDFFTHHPPLPQSLYFSDEGEANHTRFCEEFGKEGVHLFVFGRYAASKTFTNSIPRQTLEASQAIGRQHKIKTALFAEQSLDALQAGVFHNDVISVGHKHFFLYHEKAFSNTPQVVHMLKEHFPKISLLEIKSSELSLQEAVETYLFNSQIVTTKENKNVLLAPIECQEMERAHSILNSLPFDQIIFCDLRESMHNGGGPACLRIRVPLTDAELAAMNQGVLLTDTLYTTLTAWVNKHYRDHLLPGDLQDVHLLQEGKAALDELTQILRLGSLYDFQL